MLLARSATAQKKEAVEEDREQRTNSHRRPETKVTWQINRSRDRREDSEWPVCFSCCFVVFALFPKGLFAFSFQGYTSWRHSERCLSELGEAIFVTLDSTFLLWTLLAYKFIHLVQAGNHHRIACLDFTSLDTNLTATAWSRTGYCEKNCITANSWQYARIGSLGKRIPSCNQKWETWKKHSIFQWDPTNHRIQVKVASVKTFPRSKVKVTVTRLFCTRVHIKKAPYFAEQLSGAAPPYRLWLFLNENGRFVQRRWLNSMSSNSKGMLQSVGTFAKSDFCSKSMIL